MSASSERPSRPGDSTPPRAKHLRLPAAPEPVLRGDPPPLVPGRMVAETVYCERLVYLEWAQSEFAHNAHTVEGALRHERVDSPRPLPPPTGARGGPGQAAADDDDVDDGRPVAARSVWLSSETLGVTAKIDVVEGEGDRVVPIEYKKGRSAPVHHGAHLPQRVQVAVQILLLREHGFDVPYGVLWFAKDRRKVRVDLDPPLDAVTREAIRRARAITAAAVLPPPLVDDPRCHGCSLAGICLPDETTLLRGFTGEPLDDPPPPAREFAPDLYGPLEPDPWGLVHPDIAPYATPPSAHAPSGRDPWGRVHVGPAPRVRRLLPASDERIPLYVRAQGASIGLDGGQLVVRTPDGPRSVRLSDTSEVVLFGNIQVSTQALRALMERSIPVAFFSYGGWFVGRAVGQSTKNAELRVAQVRAVTDPARALDVARRMVAAKILNQRTMLRRNHAAPDDVLLGELKRLARSAFDADSLDSLRGTEGTAARLYFGAFTGMLKQLHDRPFDLDGRNRRPPRDPVNALLSLAYALLAKDATHACAGVGLEPLLGAYHQPRYGRPSLALDLMEELRPLVADSVVITSINTGVVTPDDFVHAAGSCALSDHARRRFIEAYERRMEHEVQHPLFGYRISYRRLLEVQARLLSRWMLGELPAYVPFRTR